MINRKFLKNGVAVNLWSANEWDKNAENGYSPSRMK